MARKLKSFTRQAIAHSTQVKGAILSGHDNTLFSTLDRNDPNKTKRSKLNAYLKKRTREFQCNANYVIEIKQLGLHLV